MREGPISGICAVQHSEGGRFFGRKKKKPAKPPEGCGARIESILAICLCTQTYYLGNPDALVAQLCSATERLGPFWRKIALSAGRNSPPVFDGRVAVQPDTQLNQTLLWASANHFLQPLFYFVVVDDDDC